jgi:hypothetical protein
MFTVKEYELFINELKKGKTITEASLTAKIEPVSMKNAILHNTEVKDFIDSITTESQRV